MLFEEALKDHLESLGLLDTTGAAPEWFTGLLQSEPDFAVAVLPESGLAPNGILGEFPSVTIRVRHPDPREANLFSRQIFRQLQEFSSTNLAGSGIGLARITASQGRVQIGRDQNGGQGNWNVQQTYGAIVPNFGG